MVAPRAKLDANSPEFGEASASEDTRFFNPGEPRDAHRDDEVDLDDEAFEAGTRVGRYMILDLIGSGGVGVVFTAYDPNLDRKVAIKQLRRSKLAGRNAAVSARRSRLQREAQALARLSHPNVVPVYEVASYDDQLYVVMEFVEGRSLGEWLEQESRGWSEIVAMFVQTGRGLAAAHAADIVHRDFKPDNVRVGSDARPRVLDFGLASPLRDGELEHAGERLHELIERSFDEDSWPESSESTSDMIVTREGQVMGTPAYMAPEQASGGLVSARSDQFSFCVALYEALYGRRPYRGRFDDPRRFRELSRLRTLPGKRPLDLPLGIERILLRGLSLAPERRFADMDALLTELGAVADGPRWKRWVPLAATSLALLAVIVFYERRTVEPISCESDSSLLAGVWDDGIREELRRASAASGKGYADGVWARAESSFDVWAVQWEHARIGACEATHIKEEQSPALLERRIACLDRQQTQVESMISGLRGQQQRADELLEHLEAIEVPDPDSCAADNMLEEATLDPRDPDMRERVREIRALLSAVEGLRAVGEYARARERGQAALEQARALDFEAIHAEALLTLALTVSRQNQDPKRAEYLLREAVWAAQRSSHDAVLIRAAAALASACASEQAELEAATTWIELARATFERHGEDPSIEAEVRRHFGEVALAKSDYDGALREYQRALEFAREREGERSLAYINALRSIGSIKTELGLYADAIEALEQARTLATTTLGTRHPALPELLDSLGTAHQARGELSKALELHTVALELNEALYGATHRRVAKSLNNLAIIYDETGRYAESAKTLERARTILVERLGPGHPDIAYVDVNLGSALQNLDRNTEALHRYEHALTVLEPSLGPDHMAVGVTLQNLGSVRSAIGDHAGALADFERSAQVLEALFGEVHPALASLHNNRAGALRELERADEALTAGTRALEIFEQVHGPTHHELVPVLTTLAGLELELGNAKRALEHGERALRLSTTDTPPLELALAKQALAKIVLVLPGDRVRALSLANEALAVFEKAEGNEQEQAQLRVWLEAHTG